MLHGTVSKHFHPDLKRISYSRSGKVFYLELEGNGRMPVLHFGMTGMVQVGIEPRYSIIY